MKAIGDCCEKHACGNQGCANHKPSHAAVCQRCEEAAAPIEARTGVYVDDGFYAAGAPGAPAAPGDGNYVDDGFYISVGGAGGAAAGVRSSDIVYATPFEVADIEA